MTIPCVLAERAIAEQEKIIGIWESEYVALKAELDKMREHADRTLWFLRRLEYESPSLDSAERELETALGICEEDESDE